MRPPPPSHPQRDVPSLVIFLSFFPFLTTHQPPQDPISKYRASKDEPFPEGFDHAAWRAKHVSFARENVPKWAEAVRAQYGSGETDRFACVGYCFGAPFVCELLAGDLVSAGAFAHPTALKEEQFVGLKRMYSSIQPPPPLNSLRLELCTHLNDNNADRAHVGGCARAEPLLLSCAENDHAFDAAARTKAFEVLQREGKKYHVQLFQGVGHGFAVKGDPEDPYQSESPSLSFNRICSRY